jgi:hypothetical protein
MNQAANGKCVSQIPDAASVRVDLAKNQRERMLLQKLLRLAERKATVCKLNSEAGSEVSHA